MGDVWCKGRGPLWVENGRLVKATDGYGVGKRLPELGPGRGIHRFPPKGYPRTEEGALAWLKDYMRALSDRLRFARITCGDFERVLGYSATIRNGLTAAFLDPPYSAPRSGIYAHDSFDAARRAREWAKANGDNPLFRIAICGYEGEHNELEDLGWKKLAWKGRGGYGNRGQGRGRKNAHLERIWFSPHCYVSEQPLRPLQDG